MATSGVREMPGPKYRPWLENLSEDKLLNRLVDEFTASAVQCACVSCLHFYADSQWRRPDAVNRLTVIITALLSHTNTLTTSDVNFVVHA